MIDKSQRIVSPVYQMQCLLLLGMLQYMFMAFLIQNQDIVSLSGRVLWKYVALDRLSPSNQRAFEPELRAEGFSSGQRSVVHLPQSSLPSVPALKQDFTVSIYKHLTPYWCPELTQNPGSLPPVLEFDGGFRTQRKLFDDFNLQDNVNPYYVSLSLQAEWEPPVVEEDAPKKEKSVFTHQIRKAEPLYNPIIFEAANTHNVDLAMIKAIIMAESGYNRNCVSKRGAKGLMQLMPRTAKALGVKNIFNPEENIHAGVKYYKSLLNRFGGEQKLALAAYNAGARNVRKYKGVPPFKETRRYIKKVLEYQRFYKQGPIEKEEILS